MNAESWDRYFVLPDFFYSWSNSILMNSNIIKDFTVQASSCSEFILYCQAHQEKSGSEGIAGAGPIAFIGDMIMIKSEAPTVMIQDGRPQLFSGEKT